MRKTVSIMAVFIILFTATVTLAGGSEYSLDRLYPSFSEFTDAGGTAAVRIEHKVVKLPTGKYEYWYKISRAPESTRPFLIMWPVIDRFLLNEPVNDSYYIFPMIRENRVYEFKFTSEFSPVWHSHNLKILVLVDAEYYSPSGIKVFTPGWRTAGEYNTPGPLPAIFFGVK